MMKKMFVFIALIALAIVFSVTPLQAKNSPVQLALFTPVQIVNPEQAVTGFSWNLIYGRNTSFTGIDVGIVNHKTSGVSHGVQSGFIGMIEADLHGVQSNYVNVIQGMCEGGQSGMVNYVNNMKGFQSGIVNYALTMEGFQFGLVNFAGTLSGLQIGAINIIKTGGQFPFFPIVNWSF